MEKMKTVAIVTAGGLGLRLPGDVKKQFRLLDGKPLLVRAMEPFMARSDISAVIVTLPEADLELFQGMAAEYFHYQNTPELMFCAGGEQRQDSVFNAIKLCPPETEFLLIHDGVRPFVKGKVLNELLLLAHEYGAVVPGAPVKHTIKTIKDNIIDHTIRRDILLQVYTPQVFSFNIIVKSYFRAMMEEYYSTDDAALLEHYGYSVHYLIDSSFNLKVTDEFDLYLAEQVIQYNKNSAQGN